MKINLTFFTLIFSFICDRIINKNSKERPFKNNNRRNLVSLISYTSITSSCSTTITSSNVKAFTLSDGINLLINQCSLTSNYNNQVYLYSSSSNSKSNLCTGSFNSNAFNNIVHYTSNYNSASSTFYAIIDDQSCGSSSSYGVNCNGTGNKKLNFIKYVFSSSNPLKCQSQTNYLDIFSKVVLGVGNIIFCPVILNCPFNTSFQLFVGLEMSSNNVIMNIYFQFVNTSLSINFLDKKFGFSSQNFLFNLHLI